MGLTSTDIFGGLQWWIGQIADDSTWRDNQLPGKFKDVDTIPGWGYRYKVRIMGKHDHGSTDNDPVPEDQLPWANVMYPITAGGGQGACSVTPNLRQGNIVFGFYLDGKDEQHPIIMGVLGNNSQTPLGKTIGKVDEEGPTNETAQDSKIGKSGFPNKQEIEKEGAAAEVPEFVLKTGKPKTPEQSQECASPAPGTPFNKYGLPASLPLSASQLADAASATSQGEIDGLSGLELAESVKQAVATGVLNRCGIANSPLSPPQKGAEKESTDNPHCLSADDVNYNDKLNECIVTAIQHQDAVGAATKRIQIETKNLSDKCDKLLGSMKNYIDAVSGPPSEEDIKKEVKNTACKIAKYQKIIMDKVGEYQTKKMNKELTLIVAAMPSSLRYLFADQKFLNTQNTVQEYNKMTNEICDQMEGILTAKLDIPNLIKQAKSESISGVLWSNPTSQSAVSGLLDLGGGGGSSSSGTTGGGSGSSDGSSGGGSDDVTTIKIPDPQKPRTPKVPMCYAEDLVAQGIAVNKDKMSKIANDQHKNYNRFLEGVKSQLEKTDQEMNDKAEDMSNIGRVTAISDEAPAAAYEPIGGTNYYTQTGVPCTGGTGSGFKVDIVVSTGGWYDNGFATINDEGAGYYVDTANGGGVSGTGTTESVATTGGSGSGVKVNFTIASGKITGITTNTAGSNYKDGDVLTILQGSQAAINPTTYATFTINKVRGVVERLNNGGIKINDPGVGYKMGDVLIANQQGSGENAAMMVTQVFDLGNKRATAGPVTPGDLAGAVGQWVPPKPPSKPAVDPVQKLGDMLSMLGGMQGSLTQAFDFKNVMGNMFPFEPPPNPAVSDCYTLSRGGTGVPEPQTPSSFAIDKAVGAVKDVAKAVPPIPFGGPSLGQLPIDIGGSKAMTEAIQTGAQAALKKAVESQQDKG